MSENYTTTPDRNAGRQRRPLADRRAGRRHRAARPLPGREARPVQPRAHPGAHRARQGRRRLRRVRGDRRRHARTPRPRSSSPGTSTETLQRFSSVAGEQGSPDTWRDVRGFSVKFYTTEGNYDIVGNNTPVFFIRDGIKFPDFIHSQKRLPGSGLRDADMQWDFWTLSPESAHQVTYLMGDRGIPRSWRHMPGYGSHTYQWINAAGERFWVKYHFHALQGNEEIDGAEAEAIAGADADYYRRDLYEAIERGRLPVVDGARCR